jgi:hypothetical protein
MLIYRLTKAQCIKTGTLHKYRARLDLQMLSETSYDTVKQNIRKYNEPSLLLAECTQCDYLGNNTGIRVSVINNHLVQ